MTLSEHRHRTPVTVALEVPNIQDKYSVGYTVSVIGNLDSTVLHADRSTSGE